MLETDLKRFLDIEENCKGVVGRPPEVGSPYWGFGAVGRGLGSNTSQPMAVAVNGEKGEMEVWFPLSSSTEGLET